MYSFLQKLFPVFDNGSEPSYKGTVASPQGRFYEQFGLKLAEARRAAKISQEALSKSVGLSRTSIVNIEKGRQPVSLHLVAKIASTLEVTPSSLIPDINLISQTELVPDLGTVSAQNRPWVERIFSSSTLRKETDREAKILTGTTQSTGTGESGRRKKSSRPD